MNMSILRVLFSESWTVEITVELWQLLLIIDKQTNWCEYWLLMHILLIYVYVCWFFFPFYHFMITTINYTDLNQ